jgi:8-oxo-dGTP diphosphatase
MPHISTCEAELDKPMPEQATRKTLVPVVAVVLIDRDGRILLGQRPEHKAMGGLWEFHGGKIDDGEIPEYALMRECYEELGIETRPGCFIPLTFASHAYDNFHLLMPVYACRTWRGTAHANAHDSLKWVHAGAMQSYPMPEADQPLRVRVLEYVQHGL